MSPLPSKETAVPDSPGFLQATLDALSTHIAILDEKGTIIKVNAAWHRFACENHLPRARRSVGGNYLAVCDAAESCPEAKTAAAGIRAVLAGNEIEFDLEYACHDERQLRWFILHVTRFHDARQVRVVVAHENITASKRMETALQANEQRLNLALTAAKLGAFEHVAASNEILTTPGFCATLGWPCQASYPHEEWISRIHPDDRDTIMAGVERMVQAHTPVDMECRVGQADETVRWIRVMISPLTVNGVVERSYGVIQNITERKQAEAELRQFACATEQSPASVVITDLQGGIKYVNPKFCAVTGYTFGEVRGKNPRMLKSGDMSAEVYHELWSAITQGKEWRGEFHNRKKNGELYWEAASISPLRNDQGMITDFMAVKEDITLRKRAVEEVVEARQFLDQIVNTVGEPIFVKDRQHRWIMMNEANCALIHRSHAEIMGKTVRDLFPQNEAEIFWTRDEEVFTSGRESIHEETFTDASGAVHTVVTRKNRYCNAQGEFFIVGVLHDITRRKLMEGALRESERRQKAILDNIGDPAWLKDVQGRYLAVNQPLARLFGRTPENMLGQTLHDVYPEHSTNLIIGESEVILTGKTVCFETRVIDPAGVCHWFETVKSPIFDEFGTVTGTTGIGRDITGRRRAAQELADAKQFLDRIINTVSEPIFVKDRQHRYVMVNAAGCLILGRDRGSLLGLTEQEVFPLEAAKELWRATETVFETGRESIHEKKSTDSAGDTRHLVGRLNLYCNDLGEKFVVSVFHDITQRKQWEESLRESDRRQKAILDNIPDPAWLRDTAGRFLMVNRAWSEFTGLPGDLIIGKRVDEVGALLPDSALNPALALNLDEEDQALLAEKKFTQRELRINFAHRGDIWFEVSKTVLVNAGGQAIGITGIARNITERKQADAAQKEQIALRERLANVAANAPGILFSFRLRPDGSFCLPYISPTAEDFCGVRAADLLQSADPLFQLIPLGDIAALNDSIAHSARTLSPWRGEFRLQHPRKGLLWIEGRSSPQPETDGGVLWHGFMSDISDRKRAEASLRESEEKFRQLADNITDVFWVSSPDLSTIYYVSAGYETTWGFRRESLYSHPHEWMGAILPEERERVAGVFAALRVSLTTVSVEYRITRPDGSVRWIHDRGFQVRDTGGNLVRLAGIASDITDRKQAEAELAGHKRNEELSRLELEREHALNLVKTRFVSLVSHEFRTPLCAINMAAFMLSDYAEGMTHDERSGHARDIQHAVGRMTQMMEDFLTHDKAQTGRVDCHPAWVDVADFCQKLIPEVAGPLHPSKGVQFHAAPGATEAFLDLKILRHILSNLLSNAIKYSEGNQPVSLAVARVSSPAASGTQGPSAAFLEFKITDSGIGIPPADLANLYQTFHRASNVGNRPGTGMGLAIVKQFVDLHGGTIQVESTEGKGTTFWVRLPVGPSDKAAPPPLPQVN